MVYFLKLMEYLNVVMNWFLMNWFLIDGCLVDQLFGGYFYVGVGEVFKVRLN